MTDTANRKWYLYGSSYVRNQSSAFHVRHDISFYMYVFSAGQKSIFSRCLSDSCMLVCQIQCIKVAQDLSLWITQDLFVSECLLEIPMYVSTKHRLRPSFNFMGNSEIYERLAYNYQIDISILVSQGLPSLMMISRFPPGCFCLDLRQ